MTNRRLYKGTAVTVTVKVHLNPSLPRHGDLNAHRSERPSTPQRERVGVRRRAAPFLAALAALRMVL